MKRFITIIGLCLFCKMSFAQLGEWTWVHGPQFGSNRNGNYGVKSVPAILNIPPARYEAASWKDQNGNFWIFGGFKTNPIGGELNDLWMFNPLSKLWTWIHGPQLFANPLGNYGTQGISSPLNIPSARGWCAITWTGNDGKLYLYGGGPTGGGDLEDLWCYDINTNEWTWLKGINTLSNLPVHGTKGVPAVTNSPGGRSESKSTWTIDNELWFFGGFGLSQSIPTTWNDLWKYDINTNLWTWMSGDNSPNSLGTYANLGTPSTTSAPNSRWSYTNWKDAANQLYIFTGDCSGGGGGYCNDICRYNINTNEWTWLKGSHSAPILPPYVNQKCENNIQNIPLGRYENSTPISNSECSNAFWTFGGLASGDSKNDLWIYDATKNTFILAYGDPSGIQIPANYGTLQSSSPLNSIPPRFGASAWTDADENLWFFGGWDNLSGGVYNDTWCFTVDSSCFDIKSLNQRGASITIDTTICAGESFLYNNKSYSAIGTYYDTLNNSGNFNCAGIHIIHLNVLEPQIDTQEISLCSGETFYYMGNAYSESGEYEDTIRSNTGSCFRVMRTKLNIENSITVNIPNAFSPNGDDNNDCLRPIVSGIGLESFKFRIFNRYGQCIFFSETLGNCWDGNFNNVPSEIGVYFYLLNAKLTRCPTIVKKGDITLIR